MKYISPEVELNVLMAMDVITTSVTGGGQDEDGDSTLGKDEF